MAENFYSILTSVGLAKLANAQVTGNKVNLVDFAVGDGGGSYYNPTQNDTQLRNEVWRGNIGSVEVDSENPNWIVIDSYIPATDGGFTVREVGIFDDSGEMIAIGKYPETFKPSLDDGASKDLLLRMIIEVTNASAVTMKVDPSVIIASRKYVDEKVVVVSDNLTQLDNKVMSHLADDVSQGEVHGLRVTDGKLEYFDGQEWQRVKGGSGYPVGNVSNFRAKAGNGEVILTWEDPADVTITDSNGNIITIARWKGTKIMMKTTPDFAHENDGILVVDNGIRNQYAENGFKVTGLTNGQTYYFMAFPYTVEDVYTIDESNKIEATPTEAKVYGLEWNQTLDTYQRLDDAVDMVAITQGQNDFDNVYPWSKMKRCNLDDNANVLAYFGDPTYKDDGSNGQVMVQIPKFWYKSEMVIDGGQKKYRWWIADNEIDGFKLHPAFIRNGVEKDYVYIGAYEGYVSGGKLSSIAGVTPTTNKTIVQFRSDAQARGSIWHQQDFLTICAIELLYLVEYAHFDSQSKIGQGITDDSIYNKTETGETAQYGNQSFGDQNNGKIAMSYRGIENLYGNYWKWVDGININNHRAYIADHNFQSNKFDGHYRQVGFTNATANGYVKDIGWTPQDNFMFLAIDSGGSNSSFLHDYYQQNSDARVAIFGGYRDGKSNAGAFYWSFYHSSSYSHENTGARLLCVP